MQNRIPVDVVTKQAVWHSDIHPTIRSLLPGFSTVPSDLSERLARHSLRMDDFRTGSSIRREAEAREQLVLDLSMSKDVFSPIPIKRMPEAFRDAEDEAFETMSRATEAMSIGIPEPAQVQFGFLQPVFGKGNDHYADAKDDHDTKADMPLGVRLLLKEWDTGADPVSY